jgi:hypothetical protein
MSQSRHQGFGQYVGAAAAVINNVLIGIGSIVEVQQVKKALREERDAQRRIMASELTLEEQKAETDAIVMQDEAERMRLANKGLQTIVLVGTVTTLGVLTLLFGVIYKSKD